MRWHEVNAHLHKKKVNELRNLALLVDEQYFCYDYVGSGIFFLNQKKKKLKLFDLRNE